MTRVPLAEQMRPASLDAIVGQSHLVGPDGLLRHIIASKEPTSLILWGPPGTGKTTLARIIAREVHAEFYELSAVTSGKKDIEKIIEHARQNWNLSLRTILFVDEIHRFNKSQQDAFLPHVESGLVSLIGATTENPSFEVIAPLLSRCRVLVLEPLGETEVVEILTRALKSQKSPPKVDDDTLEYLAHLTSGDARAALGTLELALQLDPAHLTLESIKKAAQTRLPRYDKDGDMHYDIISAFIKSMRGSDTEATTYYLSRMIDAGEDPKFIARRMMIFASEDIGLAGNGALSLAVSTFETVRNVGLPEANYALYHCAVALSRSPKSREITDIMTSAKQLAKQFPDSPIPLHIRNAPTKLVKDLGYNKGYKWNAGHVPEEGFLPEEIRSYSS